MDYANIKAIEDNLGRIATALEKLVKLVDNPLHVIRPDNIVLTDKMVESLGVMIPVPSGPVKPLSFDGMHDYRLDFADGSRTSCPTLHETLLLILGRLPSTHSLLTVEGPPHELDSMTLYKEDKNTLLRTKLMRITARHHKAFADLKEGLHACKYFRDTKRQ